MATFQIGQYISSNGGVTTAEELAPYLDVEKTKAMVLQLKTSCFLICISLIYLRPLKICVQYCISNRHEY